MRVQATCERCGRQFLLFQLYSADPAVADRCPHCSHHLGIVGVRSLALRTDRAVDELVRCLDELAARRPRFRVDPATVVDPVRDAVSALTRRDEGEDEGEAEHDDTGDVGHRRWPWHRHRRAA